MSAGEAIIITDILVEYPRSGFQLRVESLNLGLGKITCLVGPNGSGKSVLCRAIAQYEQLQAGSIELNGSAVRVATIWQDAEKNLALDLTINENLIINLGPKRAKEVSRTLGLLSPDRERIVGHLSGGEKQLLAFACAAQAEADLLILDEFVAALDSSMRRRLLGEARRVADAGEAVLIVTHSLRTVLEVADAVVALRGGRVVYQAASGSDWDRDLIEQCLGGYEAE